MSMNFVTFNQDYSHLAVATSKGFRIYTTDPFSKCSESKTGDIAILEMLFSTSLVALILSPRRLQITNTKRQSTICELTFPTTVLAVRLNRKRLVVVLEDQIYLYDISTMKLLYTIETSPNPNAICALSSSSDNCFLAYPLPQKALPTHFSPPSHIPPSGTHITPTSGDVLLFDSSKLEVVNVVVAHLSPLSCVSLNNTGTLLATASDKGTIIRVFSVPKACHLTPPSSSHSGSRRDRSLSPADSQPDFSTSPTASEGADPGSARKHNGTLLGMIRRTSQNVSTSLATSVGAYLPTAVAEMWEPMRDFAWCKIPKSPASGPGVALGTTVPLRSVVAMSSNSPQVMVVTNEGHFYVFGIDLEKGGEGTLVKVYEVGGESEQLED